jgi:hypothetical protein
MKHFTSFALAAGAVLLACSGKTSSSQSSQFPYLGPSCDRASNTFYSDSCWQCSQSQCAADCETTDCVSYFECYCACAPGGPPAGDSGLNPENACQAACEMTSACSQCRDALGQCQAQKCEPECGYVDAG